MKILVAGSSGLIGTALVQKLEEGGHEIVRLVRRQAAAANEVRWDPAAGSIEDSCLIGVEAVVHLGGASIGGRRWNAAFKEEIRSSRVNSTSLLSETIARLAPRPKVFLCASALGYYGDRGDEALTEDSTQGSGFIADSTAEWEAACQPATAAGVRVCNLRIGIVLSRTGDLPKRMLLPFRLGLGGKLGNGRQYMSWVHIEDVVRAIVHVLETPTLHGPVNLSSPNAVTNADFTGALAGVLSRPALFTVPSFALRLAMGESAQMAMESCRMHPQLLLESGFTFEWEHIEPALRDLLDK